MTDRTPGDFSPARTDAIEESAGRWLERAALGDLTPEEAADFETWKSQSLSHRVAFVRLEAVWQRTERLAALRRPMMETPDATSVRKVWPRFHHAAIVVVLVLLGAVVTFGARRTNETIYTTDIGNREIISLTDGSRIELNTNSSVRVHLVGDRREVFLDKGEAYFDVAHDAARPFTVAVAGHRITDLGTKFSVRENADNVEVSLLEGRARLDLSQSAQSPQSATLTPGDVAIATATAISVQRATSQTLANQLGWRRGVIVFDNAPLGEAVAEVNRYNHTRLVVADPSVSRLTISGTFPADRFQIVLEAARDVYGLHVKAHDGEILISR